MGFRHVTALFKQVLTIGHPMLHYPPPHFPIYAASSSASPENVIDGQSCDIAVDEAGPCVCRINGVSWL